MANLVPLPHALLDRLSRAVDIDRVLRLASFPRSRFGVPRPEATSAEFFALWRAVEESGAAPDLALRLGVETLSDYEDVAMLAALHSATLGEGLHKFARYKRLVCPEKVWIDVSRKEARLRFEWLRADGPPPPMVTDLLFAFIVAVAARGTTKAVRPRRVELARRRANEPMLRRHFGCEVRFDAPHDVLVFDESTLALPMVHRNSHVLSVLLPGLESAVAKADHERTLDDEVRAVLLESLCGPRPGIAGIAKSLGMSARSLQRRLGELGTTYQELLDDVRRQTARRLLASTELGSGEIAFVLGFEEVNSFVRAFRGWEEVSPTTWRERARALRETSEPARRSAVPDRRRTPTKRSLGP